MSKDFSNMPEGWRNQVEIFNDSVYLRVSYSTQNDWLKGLMLMKEMAEALDKVVNTPSSSPEHKYVLHNAGGILSKFKEWK